MATATPSLEFARLPTELKLLLLKEHTSFLQQRHFMRYGRNRRVLKALDAFSHSATERTRAFLPNVKDLVQLHYPQESRIIPFDFFLKFYATSPRCHDSYWVRYHLIRYRMTDARKRGNRFSDKLLWLRYLGTVRARIEEIIECLDRVFYPGFNKYYIYTGLLHLWRFLGPFDSTTPSAKLRGPTIPPRLRYIASLAPSQQQCFHDTLDHIFHAYACHADYEYIDPFRYLRNQYRDLVDRQGIAWKQFAQCGAFAACLKHYVLQLSQTELIAVFCNKRAFRSPNAQQLASANSGDYEQVWLRPETYCSCVLYNVERIGHEIVLRLHSKGFRIFHHATDLQCGAALWAALLELDRLWALDTVLDGDGREGYRFEQLPVETDALGEHGFQRDAVVDQRYIDGYDGLGDEELGDLFYEEPTVDAA